MHEGATVPTPIETNKKEPSKEIVIKLISQTQPHSKEL